MIWIVLAVILAAGEVMSLSFFLAPFSAGALLGALVELAGLGSVAAIAVPRIVICSLELVRRNVTKSDPIVPKKTRKLMMKTA